MPLGVLYGVPEDKEQLARWSFVHAVHHYDIIRVTFQNNGNRLVQYILDPFNPVPYDLWIYQHQVMHNQMNQLYGVTGQDLTGLDWNDPHILHDWINDHYAEHAAVGQKLGLG
jgi:hypothetical protein